MRADEIDDGAASGGAAARRRAARPAPSGAPERSRADSARTDATVARAAAATAAAARLEPGATIGLGSGRAVAAVIEQAARRWPGGPPLLAAVASSETDRLARASGWAVVSLDDLELKRERATGGARASALLDLVIDGADEVDPRLDLLKGGGGALLREKLLAAAAARLLIVVEDEKVVPHLGDRHRLPVEIVRFAWRETRRRVQALLPEARLRLGGDGRAFVTDEGHFIVDCELPKVGAEGLAALAADLKALPGVVEHALYFGVADEVLVGHADGSVSRKVRGGGT